MAERRSDSDHRQSAHRRSRVRSAKRRLIVLGNLTRNIPAPPPAPVDPARAVALDHDASYESVLVAFDEAGYSPEVMGTAARMAARRRRGIHVLVTITVPAAHPIDAPLPEQEAQAESILEEAKVQFGRRITGHWEKVRAGQTGRRILDEAKELSAEAIVMAMPGGAPGFSRAQQLVLRERPCRVIIETTPSQRAVSTAGRARR